MPRSAVWLFCSTLLAFLAAVLGLGQILANEIATSTTFVASEPLIRTKEVLFALSIGFRFLFYWSYVAEPPRKVRSAAPTQRVQEIKFLILERTHEPHSGSWMRRGLLGKLLGVSLLVAIVIITVLQIVWRVVPQFRQYSDVYAADAALELLVSFLLLLKLLLNTVTLGSPNSMLVHTFRECLAPISGLLVNIAIGVGDLLSFAFTESTVGRLLQAFEVYIIVVFVVVTAFLTHRDVLISTAPSQDEQSRDVVFTLPRPARESTFRITSPFVETPRTSMVLGTATQNKESSREALRRSAHRSLNHVSSWVSSRVLRNRPRYEDEEVKLWNAGDVKVDRLYTGSIDTELRASIASLTQEPKERAELMRSLILGLRKIQFTMAKFHILIERTSRNVRSQLQAQTSSVPISSVPPSTSPVYGLGGTQSPPSASGSRTSLDELLRQQSQLDKSIEALKLFSTRTSTNSLSSNSVLCSRSTELTRSLSTGQRTISSEVSLSNFPVPPWLTTPVPSLPSPRSPSTKRIRGDRRIHLATARPTPVQGIYPPVPPKTLASLADLPNFPGEDNESLFAEAGKSSRSDSGRTQYNVTSFIGGLATPCEPRQGSQEKSYCPTESESCVGTIQTGSDTKKLPPRMLPMLPRLEEPPASPAVTKLLPLVLSSRLPRGDVVDQPADDTQHRINDQTSRSLAIVHSPPTLVTGRAEKCMSISSTRPQLVRETGSPVSVLAEGADRVQRMFVRPRPPPLVIQSYAEQNSGTPRVQVLADN
ncbi:hypothetical protein J3R83DRAFT_6725 [Lanmaoa asiatica]|nr:hypothetical protein J3R83DRAFT_6725 [Lanmaoa asiatica]